MTFKLTLKNLNTKEALEQINNNRDLFGENDLRTRGDSPHRESKDIWFRFVKGDMLNPSDMHWLDGSNKCPAVKDIATKVLNKSGCSELGGVLCTLLPSGCKIYPHTDKGWHADAHRKFYVPLQADKETEFVFDGKAIPAKIGEAWEFDNSVSHWVNNNSLRDRIVLIICVR